MKDLLNDLKSGQMKKVYLLFGDERYLVKLYEHKIKEKVVDSNTEMMNMDIFEGKSGNINDIISSSLTLPFLSEKRLIIFRDSGLFYTGRKDDTEKMANHMENPPMDCIMVFIEEQVDKRNKLYKKVSAIGRAIELKTPSENELVNWVVRLFKEKGKTISGGNASFLLRTVSTDMGIIVSEVEKLIDFARDKSEISQNDIEQLCTKSLESKIFDMIGAVGNKKPDIALDIFNNLVLMKESPIMVITMLGRQFRLILQCKELGKNGFNPEQIATEIGQRSFVVKECLKQGKNFSEKILLDAIKDCLETDINIKTGKIKDKLALELLIVKYSGKEKI